MSYPASINSIPSRTDGVEQIIYSNHMNVIRTALLDLVTILGNSPQGNKTNVEDRLDVRIDADGLLKLPHQTVSVGKTAADFTTITAALASISDASSNKIYTILVYPGRYDETFILKNYVNIIAIDRTSTIILNSVYDNNVECHCVLSFCIESGVNFGIHLEHASSVISFFGDISTTSGTCIWCDEGSLDYFGNLSCEGSGTGYYVTAGTHFFTGDSISGGNACIYVTGGSLLVYGNSVVSGGALSPLLVAGGTLNFIGDVTTDVSNAITLTSGVIRIRDSRIINNYNNATGHGIGLLSGTLILQNVCIVCLHADAKSINSSGAIDCRSMSVWSNRDDAADVTQVITGGFTFDSDVQ